MFDFIRTHQRLMQLVLLVLILPSFALIGISGYSTYVSGDEEIVKVGDGAITLQEFEQARRDQLQRLQASSGGVFDPSILDNSEARRNLLESLIDRRVIIDQATEQRFSVSDNVLRQTIASIPQLQEDGHFSPQRYSDVLASMGMTTRDFEQSQRAEMALQRVLAPVGDTASVPQPVLAEIAKALTAERTIRLRTFSAADYADTIKVTSDDIKAWYDKQQDQLRVPEYVVADYLVLDEAAAVQSVREVNEDDLRAYYEQNKARYTVPARVQLSHILIQAPAGATDAQRDEARSKARELAKQAAADPARFAELAQEYSQDAGTAKEGGNLGWITRGSWPSQLEQTVFALKKGEVSEVVEGPDGYHVFLATNVQPERGETFEQAKGKIESEIRRQLAAERFADMATRLTDLAYDNPESLEPAAQALGLQIRTAAGIAIDRLLPAAAVDGKAASDSEDAALLDDPRVRRALFSSQSYTDKQNSGVIEISPDTVVVVRVKEIVPSHVQPLEDAEPFIRAQITAQRSLEAARIEGEAALARLHEQKDDSLEGFGSPLTISRINPQGVQKPVMDAAFEARTVALPAHVGVEGGGGYIIVRVESAEEGKADEGLMESLSAQLSLAQGQAEERAALQALRKAANVELLPSAQEAIAGESTDS